MSFSEKKELKLSSIIHLLWKYLNFYCFFHLPQHLRAWKKKVVYSSVMNVMWYIERLSLWVIGWKKFYVHIWIHHYWSLWMWSCSSTLFFLGALKGLTSVNCINNSTLLYYTGQDNKIQFSPWSILMVFFSSDQHFFLMLFCFYYWLEFWLSKVLELQNFSEN